MAYQLAFDLENNATQIYLTKVAAALPTGSETLQSKYDKVKSILSGKETIKLQLEFLCKNNHTDMLILKNSKVRLSFSNCPNCHCRNLAYLCLFLFVSYNHIARPCLTLVFPFIIQL